MSKRIRKRSQLFISNIHLGISEGFQSQWQRVSDFKQRRPHRSFKMSDRIDTYRPLQIEGYFQFSRFVIKTMRRHRRFFMSLTLIALLGTILFAGLMSQGSYTNLKTAIEEVASRSDNEGFQNKLYRTGLMFISTVGTGGLGSESNALRTTFLALIVIVLWLSTVWFLRNSLAGHRLRTRDALYNCGSPIVAMLGVLAMVLLQLIPLAIYIIVYAAAVTTGYIAGGVEAMMFAIVGVLIVALTLYWVIGSFLALIVVTLPGVYPMEAIRIAGDLVVGRRVKIILRLLWHFLQVFGLWVIILFPMIALEAWLSNFWSFLDKIPLVPLIILILTIVSLLWTSSYIYLFYRRVIDDESRPA